MTVAVQTTFTASVASGATTVFPYGFKIAHADDLAIEFDGVAQTSGFTVSGVGDASGGDITFDVAPTAGTKVLRYLKPILKRETDYQQFGDWMASVVNLDLDRLWLAMQMLAQNTSRSLKLPVDTATNQEITQDAATRANKGFKFDGSGNLILSDFDPDEAQTDSAANAASASASASSASSSASAAAGFASDASDSEVAAAAAAAAAAASAASVGFTKTDLQNQTFTAFTSAGTAPAFTLTPAPAIAAYTAGQRFRVHFHAASAGSDTLNVSAKGAKSLKQYDSTGAKVAATLAANQLADVEYDGTDMVVLDQLPAAQIYTPPVRQTILSGPVDSNGFAAFGGATGATTVTASGTLKATAAAGVDSNRTGSITNPSWTGLSTNGAMYLYLDIAADGTCTPGSTTLAPTYRWGGADVTTNNQNTFNIQEMAMKVGNGSAASQVYRVFVGEVTVAGGVVSAITWYALMGRFLSTTQTMTSDALISVNHNIGHDIVISKSWLNVTTAFGRFALGDKIHGWSNGPFSNAGEYFAGTDPDVNKKTAAIHISNNSVFTSPASGAMVAITLANVNLQMMVKRAW